MMGAVSVSLVLFATVVVSCSGKVYKPCELAEELKNRYKQELTRYLEGNVPLAVCIAGYHNYDTSHTLEHPDGSVSYGIFGLKYLSTVEQCRKHDNTDHTNDNLQGDLVCLNKTVLAHPDKSFMYKRLCASDLTRKCTCEGADCSGKEPVFVPIYKDIIDVTYGEQHEVFKYLSERKIDYYYGQLINTTQTPAQTTTPEPSAKSPGNAEQVITISHSDTNIISTAFISLTMIALVVVVYHLYNKYVKERIASSMAPVSVFNPMHEERSFVTET